MQLTTDQYHIMMNESWNHAREIRRPYGEIDEVLAWCKQEMGDEWRWQLIDVSTPAVNGRYIFYFNSERDYFTFSLRWA